MQNTSLEILWNQLHNRLYRFIRSRLPDEADAEDILQEVFLRIHTHLDTIQDMRKVEGWVYQIARNSIADYYRNQHFFGELPIEQVDDFPVYDEYPEEGKRYPAGLLPL
jgi:RNA polymerase sigma-70 factor (ECF subfamily)